MNGKGDSPRPVDRERFETNYDEIQWNERSEVDCEGCQVGCRSFEKTGVVCLSKSLKQKSKPLCLRKEGREMPKDPGK